MVAYGKILNTALHKQNEEKLWILAMGKCERINKNEYGRKDYINKNFFSHYTAVLL